MSSSKYFIKVKTPYNVPVLNVNEFYKLELFRSEFGVGSLYVDFPLQEAMRQNISTDWRLEVYRRTSGGELVRVGDTQWIIKLVRYKVDEQNEAYLHILAYDAMYMLDKRIVAYVDGTPYTDKTMPADNMLKAIVRENLGSLATDYHRDLSNWLVVEQDTSTAPVVTKSEFGLQKVMPVLNDICQLSEAAGMYLSYDVIYDESIGKLIFRTYTNQRGADRGSNSPSPIYLAHHTDPVNVMGSGLNYASIEIDATDERSYIYSGRQAEETNAIFAEIGNSIALDSGPFARSEDFITTGESVEYNDVMTEAHAWMQEKFRNLMLNAHIQETNDMQFGVDYGFGDILALRYLGTTLNVHIDEFKITLAGDGKEDISVTSTNTEKELLIPPLTGLNGEPLTKNEPLEDDKSFGTPLFYKHKIVAQSFIVPARDAPESPYVSIDYAEIMMRRSGLPERNVSVQIADNNGPGGMPGTILGTAITKEYYTFADGIYTWAHFKFEPAIQLSENATYWLVVTCGIAKDSEKDYYLIGVDPETRYPNGACRVSTDGVTFMKYTEHAPSDKGWESADGDIPFKTYKNSVCSYHSVKNSSTILGGYGTTLITEIAQQVYIPAAEITNITINARRYGLPGDLRISLSEWDADANEPGTSLVSASIEALDISNDVFDDHDVRFSAPELLESGKLYCIVLSASGLNTNDYYRIAVDTTSGYTPGAAYKLSVVGEEETWVALGSDIYFKVYKLVPDIASTIYGSDFFDVGKTNTDIMQTFRVGLSTRLFRLGVYVAKTGDPTDDLRISVYELLDGKPHTQVTGFTLDHRLVEDTFAWYEDDLNGATISYGKTYGIWFSASGDDNNYYKLKYDSDEGYVDGEVFVDKIETVSSDVDMLFRIGQKLS